MSDELDGQADLLQQQRQAKMSRVRIPKHGDEPVHTQCCRRLLFVALCLGLTLWIFMYAYQRCYRSTLNFEQFLLFPASDTVTNVSSQTVDVKPVSASVQSGSVRHTTDKSYASIGIDSSLIQERFKNFNVSSVKLLTLAKALTSSYVRVGGTAEDLLVFSNSLTNNVKTYSVGRKPHDIFEMTEWDKINKFVSGVGWHLVFGLNILLRNDSDWDPTNAVSLMKYSDQKGYKMHLELGNEPNSFKHVFHKTVDPSQSGKDFGVLRNVMETLRSFKSSLLIGPDVTSLIKKKPTEDLTASSKDYLRRFLQTGCQHIDVVTFHHYYVRSQTATAQDFTDPDILDSLQGQITLAQSIINATCKEGKQLWLGEAGSASGGGAPLLSDRYVAGFMWLDRLGLSAVLGVNVVIRQSFYKGHYAMIDRLNYTPFPDYWLTLLYKKLVGQRVLQAITNTSSNKIRLYAHCTNTDDRSTYQPGAVTLYILNLYQADLEMTFPQFQENDIHLYLLTPVGAAGLHSSSVSLNGHVLEMKSESELPVLEPKIQSGHLPVDIKALTFGFIVIPQANFTICR